MPLSCAPKKKWSKSSYLTYFVTVKGKAKRKPPTEQASGTEVLGGKLDLNRL